LPKPADIIANVFDLLNSPYHHTLQILYVASLGDATC